MQLPLPLERDRALSYECMNPQCFYVETLLSFSDVIFKERWSSEVHDLIMVAHCPACIEPMAHWSDSDG